MEGHLLLIESQIYLIPLDGMRDFLDTDIWIIVSDSIVYPPAPLRPYGVLIHDCLSRYFKEYQNQVVEGRTSIAQEGFVRFLATTPQTREDIISFHGISPNRVFLTPIEFGMDFGDSRETDTAESEGYFIWPTNISPHKNHINAVEAYAVSFRWRKIGCNYHRIWC